MNAERTIIAACRPWRSPDRVEEKIIPGEPQANIDYCLQSCPYADTECVNCLGSRVRLCGPGAGRPSKIDAEKLRKMLMQRRPQAEICAAFGVSLRTLQIHKKKLMENAG